MTVEWQLEARHLRHLCVGRSSSWTWPRERILYSAQTQHTLDSPNSLRPAIPSGQRCSGRRKALHCLHGSHSKSFPPFRRTTYGRLSEGRSRLDKWKRIVPFLRPLSFIVSFQIYLFATWNNPRGILLPCKEHCGDFSEYGTYLVEQFWIVSRFKWMVETCTFSIVLALSL